MIEWRNRDRQRVQDCTDLGVATAIAGIVPNDLGEIDCDHCRLRQSMTDTNATLLPQQHGKESLSVEDEVSHSFAASRFRSSRNACTPPSGRSPRIRRDSSCARDHRVDAANADFIAGRLDHDVAAIMQADGPAEFGRQVDTPGRGYSPMDRIHG